MDIKGLLVRPRKRDVEPNDHIRSILDGCTTRTIGGHYEADALLHVTVKRSYKSVHTWTHSVLIIVDAEYPHVMITPVGIALMTSQSVPRRLELE